MFRSTHAQTDTAPVATFETHVIFEYTSQELCEVTVRMQFIASCSLQIHPSRSCLLGGLANISQDESACMNAHTESPVSTRRSNHAAFSNSPRTDNGDGGCHKYVISHCRREVLQHTSRPHFAPLQSSSPTCEQDRFVGRYVSLLDPGVQLQIFHMLDFSFISSLDSVGGQSVDQGAFIA